MASAAEDTTAELENVLRHHKSLAEVSPDHRLLQIATIHEDGLGMTFSGEVKDEFWPEGGRRIHFYWSYIEALKEARNQICEGFRTTPIRVK